MQNLKTIRRARGWPQCELATRARVAVTTVCNIESRRFVPSVSQADKIAAALGVEVGDVRELANAVEDRRGRARHEP